MSSSINPAAPDISQRRTPGLGGFNLTVLAIEVRRLTRNRRTIIFALVVPIALFLLVGLGKKYAQEPDGEGNVSAFVMISVALYGAVLSTAAGGAMVSIERAAGWSRQLRLTPLSPAAYIAIKLLAAMVLGMASVAAVFIIGRVTGKPDMPASVWIGTGLSVWVGSLLFAAFGLFLGFLVPTENVMQFLGLIVAVLAFAGGLFIPVSQFSSTVQDVAKFTPLYGLNQLVHAPLLNQGVDWTWAVNVVIWLAIFAGGAIWRFRLDTARV